MPRGRILKVDFHTDARASTLSARRLSLPMATKRAMRRATAPRTAGSSIAVAAGAAVSAAAARGGAGASSPPPPPRACLRIHACAAASAADGRRSGSIDRSCLTKSRASPEMWSHLASRAADNSPVHFSATAWTDGRTDGRRRREFSRRTGSPLGRRERKAARGHAAEDLPIVIAVEPERNSNPQIRESGRRPRTIANPDRRFLWSIFHTALNGG